ncbi:Uncharacterised protein [Escherichia coli]|uniref:Uncharacterized protein n=1 Tax=Escherichia coli TaxID=562 RepID=A0A377CW64_ECOLX|nr:Uncharacterised protein [Escherichia coli]
MGFQAASKVYRHANTDEKQPQQQTFKWFDIALQRMTVFRACQQYARQKRAHRHRQADLFQQQTKAKHEE